MGNETHAGPERRHIIRTVVISIVISVVAVLTAIYFRTLPGSDAAFKAQPALVVTVIVLLTVFYAAVLVSVANLREMSRSVSGWLDVIVSAAFEAVLAYWILGDLVYTSLTVLLCSGFVLYLHFAQR